MLQITVGDDDDAPVLQVGGLSARRGCLAANHSSARLGSVYIPVMPWFEAAASVF